MRREVLTTPDPVTLVVQLPSGEVDVETIDTTETTVELEPLNDPGAEAVQQARVEMRGRAGGQEVLVEIDKQRLGLRLKRSPSVRVTVRLPHGSSLEVSSASADLQARGRYEAVDLKTASGDAKIDDVAGEARVKSVSGDVEVRRVGGDASLQVVSGDVNVGRLEGRGTIRSVSGDIEVREAETGLSAQSVSGDQSIQSALGGTITMQSVSGDLVLGVRSGSRLFVDARSTSGHTSSELELGDKPSSDGGELVELRAKSISGDIRIVRG